MDYEQLDGPIWQLPCDIEVNVTFKFGGVAFPVNPLDTTVDLNATDNDGNRICFGAVRTISGRWQNDETETCFTS